MIETQGAAQRVKSAVALLGVAVLVGALAAAMIVLALALAGMAIDRAVG